MTALIDSSRNNHVLILNQKFKETPGVKNLQKGYKLFPRETLRTLLEQRNMGRNLCILVIAFVHLAVAVILSAPHYNLNVLAVAAILITFTVCSPMFLICVPVRRMLASPDSMLSINKQRRAEIKKTRSLAKQLGDTVVPLLTEEHINSILNVHTMLLMAREDAGKAPVSSTDDYERIANLLLVDIKRKTIILDLIQNRGLLTMDDLEAAIREIEEDTIGPVQSGWL